MKASKACFQNQYYKGLAFFFEGPWSSRKFTLSGVYMHLEKPLSTTAATKKEMSSETTTCFWSNHFNKGTIYGVDSDDQITIWSKIGKLISILLLLVNVEKKLDKG